MVAVSRQCPFGAGKPGGIFDKGTKPELRHKRVKSPYKSGCQIFIMPGSFEF